MTSPKGTEVEQVSGIIGRPGLSGAGVKEEVSGG